MTRVDEHPFEQIRRLLTTRLGAELPREVIDDWPDVETVEVTIDNTAAFLWNDHEVFAKWFADTDAIEVLVVAMPADPQADHFEFVVDTEAAAPDGFEVEVINALDERPIIVALNYPQAPHAGDDAIEADLDTLFEIADSVAHQVC